MDGRSHDARRYMYEYKHSTHLPLFASLLAIYLLQEPVYWLARRCSQALSIAAQWVTCSSCPARAPPQAQGWPRSPRSRAVGRRSRPSVRSWAPPSCTRRPQHPTDSPAPSCTGHHSAIFTETRPCSTLLAPTPADANRAEAAACATPLRRHRHHGALPQLHQPRPRRCRLRRRSRRGRCHPRHRGHAYRPCRLRLRRRRLSTDQSSALSRPPSP